MILFFPQEDCMMLATRESTKQNKPRGQDSCRAQHAKEIQNA